MKKKNDFFIQIIFTILILVSLIISALNILGNKNNQFNNKIYSKALFEKINSIDVDKIREFEITHYYNKELEIKRVINRDDKLKFLSYLKSLDIYSQSGTYEEVEDDSVIYSIRILEYDYYPQGNIQITKDALFYKGVKYKVPTNIVEDIDNIIYQ